MSHKPPAAADPGWVVLTYWKHLAEYEAAAKAQQAAGGDPVAKTAADLRMDRAREAIHAYKRSVAQNLLTALRMLGEEFPEEVTALGRANAAALAEQMGDYANIAANAARAAREAMHEVRELRKELEAMRGRRPELRVAPA